MNEFMIDLESIASKILSKNTHSVSSSPEMVMINGKMHEVECYGDHKLWYVNNKLHREDGPAVEHTDGDKFWYINDELHREDGPAIEKSNGDKSWYLNGLLHREDGPAVEQVNGKKLWYLNGHKIKYDEKTWDHKVQENRIRNIMKI